MTAPSLVSTDSVCFFTHHQEFPGNSRLFLDYLHGSDQLAAFFPGFSSQILSVQHLATLAPTIAAEHLERDTLVEVLLEQNRNWGATPHTFAQIDRLRNPQTVAIVGGQQAGLFGGPLLSVYKALTVIHLADQLTHAGTPAVPVFWIASEDHDFAEVNHTVLFGRDGGLVKIPYQDSALSQPPVGKRTIESSIDQSWEALVAALPETDFTAGILAGLREAYATGAGWCDAFARWMTRLFSQYGLIVMDPRDARLKTAARQVFEAAISDRQELASAIHRQSQALVEAGYHAQVKTDVNQSLVFVELNETRTSLIQTSEGFQTKSTSGDQHLFSAEALMAIFESDPLRITPNALLRPVVQDVLLPTVAQVVGPAELAYLAQSQPIYDHLKRTAPVRWPRSGMTLVERRHLKTLEKFQFSLIDVVSGEQTLMRRILTEILDSSTADLFTETEALFNTQLDKLQASLDRQDPTLAKALAQSREKILYQLNHLQNRFLNSRSQAEDATRRQIERAVVALYPDNAKQEREMNLLPFLARYGWDLVDRLHRELKVDPAHHQWLVV